MDIFLQKPKARKYKNLKSTEITFILVQPYFCWIRIFEFCPMGGYWIALGTCIDIALCVCKGSGNWTPKKGSLYILLFIILTNQTLWSCLIHREHLGYHHSKWATCERKPFVWSHLKMHSYLSKHYLSITFKVENGLQG